MTDIENKIKCTKCGSENVIKTGKTWNKKQRYGCKNCRKMFVIKE